MLFGTGKYLELSDRSITSQPDQYLFGLKDDGYPISSPYSLTDNRLITQTITQSGDQRYLSENLSGRL